MATDPVSAHNGHSPVPSGTLRLGDRAFPAGSYAVMAVINRTPDSFYDQGVTFAFDSALRAAKAAVAQGADIIDIGGVKAGYGEPVTVEQEIQRTVPLITELRARYPGLVVSVDTWRAEVARACIDAGADLLNDTWSGADPELARVAAAADVGLVCSHSGGLAPRTDPHRVAYDDVVADVIDTVTGLAERAVASGLHPDRVLVDPTHDFGKNTYHSLLLTRRLHELVATGWPVLVAVSNKDFIGETLGTEVTDRLAGTLATLTMAAWQGARVFRVHDVAAARSALDRVASLSADET